MRAVLPLRGVTQHMTATLNGIVLGDAQVREAGWQTVSTRRAAACVVQIGVNALDLFFSRALRRRETVSGC